MKLKASLMLALASLGLLAATQATLAGDFGDADVDSRFRAKIVKEKARQASIQQELDRRNQSQNGNPSADCGSQNIGNVDTGGRPGTAPREIFVFAPNAINVVSGRGCGN